MHAGHGIMLVVNRQDSTCECRTIDRDTQLVGEVGRMNIYFSCSLTGGRDEEAVYRAIVEHLYASGHEVPTAHLALPEVMELEKIIDPAEVYQRDIAWLQACDGVIAEISTPSHGVGYEISYALNLGKSVLCCYRQGVTVSKMLIGNDTPGILVRSYENETDMLEMVDVFLAGLSAH
jgi:nucleoside 2-deoxyribosyltransferase